jgi:hypothetical protein
MDDLWRHAQAARMTIVMRPYMEMVVV